VISLSVSLSTNLSVSVSSKSHIQTSPILCMFAWLAALQYVMYFRFLDDAIIFLVLGPVLQATQVKCKLKVTHQKQYRDGSESGVYECLDT